MTKKDFLTGKPFRYDLDNINTFKYDGSDIKIKNEFYDFYCRVIRITSNVFEVETQFFGCPHVLTILYSRCTLEE